MRSQLPREILSWGKFPVSAYGHEDPEWEGQCGALSQNQPWGDRCRLYPPFYGVCGGGGGEREGLKEEEEEERLCRDPKAAPLLRARPYLKLSSPPSPRERGRSRELGVGEKETERGNQRKLQKSMAWNQRQPQQLQCDFDSPIITLN